MIILYKKSLQNSRLHQIKMSYNYYNDESQYLLSPPPPIPTTLCIYCLEGWHCLLCLNGHSNSFPRQFKNRQRKPSFEDLFKVEEESEEESDFILYSTRKIRKPNTFPLNRQPHEPYQFQPIKLETAFPKM